MVNIFSAEKQISKRGKIYLNVQICKVELNKLKLQFRFRRQLNYDFDSKTQIWKRTERESPALEQNLSQFTSISKPNSADFKSVPIPIINSIT